MTNRPDKLDVDIKRAGRLDRKIPLLYAQEATEVVAVLAAQMRKHRLDSALTFPADRATVSEKLVGLSNPDLEAVVMLAAGKLPRRPHRGRRGATTSPPRSCTSRGTT